eukprot:6082149-Lingulodinium_polyedra.AAC.1
MAQSSLLTSILAERAQAKYSMGGDTSVKLLGTHPCNRSSSGVSGFRARDIVASIKCDGLSRRRYRDAT